MKKFSLVFLSLLLLSFNGFTQNSGLSEFEEISNFKKELVTNLNSEKELPSIHSEFLTPGLKSTQDDYGDPPGWGLVNAFGGSGKDNARKVAVAQDGSFFVTGSFSGEISIESNNYLSVGQRDAFLAKFQSDGSLIWFNQFSPLTGETIDAYGIHIDESGNVYFTGYYTGDVSFGEFDLPGIFVMNLFVVVANSDGEISLATGHSTSNPLELGFKVDTDDDGNIYVLGSTDGNVYFRSPSVIIKYAPDGTMQMDYYHDQNFCDMKIVGDNIYFTGTINSPDYIGDFYLEPISYNDAFVAKSNTNMEFAWAYMAGHNTTYGDSYGISMYVSPDEDVFFTGFYRMNIVWGSIELTGSGGFVTRCSSDGIFSWVEQVSEYYNDMKPTDITGNSESVFISYFIEPYNSPSKYKTKAFSFSGVPGLIADLEDKVESISYNANNSSLVITLDKDELIGISALEETSLIPEWSLQFEGNSAAAFSIGTDVDQSGFMYNYGYASNQIDYFGQTINKGLFLTKQDGSGTPMWIVQFLDADDFSNWLGNTLIVDTITNSVYITGTFFNPLVIPDGPTLTPDISGSIFILKYDLEGNYQWAVQEDFYGSELCLATDHSGNILLSGIFSGSINIENTELISAGSSDVFIVKYNGLGEFDWAKRAGGEETEYMGLISTDGQDNVYLTGEFTSVDVTVDDYAITLEEGDGNVLFAKFDPQGNVSWVSVKSGSAMQWGDYYSWPTSIQTDNEGNTYIKGWHADSASFDNIMLVSLFDKPGYNNKWNKFIAKFDTEGNTIWAKSISELQSSYEYNQFDIDQSGNVYSSLYRIRDTILFGDEFMYIPSGFADILVINYSIDGELIWVKSIGNPESGNAEISSVAVYNEETIYVNGWFTNSLDFGSISFEADNKNGFIGVLGDLVGTTEYLRKNESLLFELFPNPAHQEINILLNSDLQNEAHLIITDITGKNIYSGKINNQMVKTTIDLSGFSPGVYFAKLQSGNKSEVKKFVIN